MGVWPTFYNWCDECKSYIAEHNVVKHKYSRKCPACGNSVSRHRNVDSISYYTIKQATEELLRKNKLEYVPNRLPKKGTGYIPVPSAESQRMSSSRWRQPHKRTVIKRVQRVVCVEDAYLTRSSKNVEYSESSGTLDTIDEGLRYIGTRWLEKPSKVLKMVEQKQKIIEMTADELVQYVYYFNAKTVYELFDWKGCKPLVNEKGFVVGVVADGQENESLMNYDEKTRVYRIRN